MTTLKANRAQSPRLSLPFDRWPAADQQTWQAACRPHERLKRGGAAAHLKLVTREMLIGRYALFLGFVDRTEGVVPGAHAGSYVTPERVATFVTELEARVSSVTVHTSIHLLRRTAQILLPHQDFNWLVEIEKDLAFVMQPSAKSDRLVYAQLLVEAGMTLMAEVDAPPQQSTLAGAQQYRDGLMVALLALCPVRLKNYAALEIGRTFTKVNSIWWIILPASETKERRPDERPVPSYLNCWIDRYLGTYRSILGRNAETSSHLWLSVRDGGPLSYSSTQQAIGQATLATIGIRISPHLFRAAGATTAAVFHGKNHLLGRALLHHSHSRVTQESYNRPSSLRPGQEYAALIKQFRDTG